MRSESNSQKCPRRYDFNSITHRKAGNAASDDEDALVGVGSLVGIDALVEDELAIFLCEIDVGEDIGG